MACFVSSHDEGRGIPGLILEHASSKSKHSVPGDLWRCNNPHLRKVSEDNISALSGQNSLAKKLNQEKFIMPPDHVISCEPAAFTSKLYALLEDAETVGFEDVVSWCLDGKAFKVHNRKKFSEVISANYFQQTRYKSFLRQLNLYGFQRISRGVHKGLCSHKFFIRGQPGLCSKIQRAYQVRRGTYSSNLGVTPTDSLVSSGDECSSGEGEEDSSTTTDEGNTSISTTTVVLSSFMDEKCGIDVFGGKSFFPVDSSMLETGKTNCDGLLLLLEGREPADLVVSSPSSSSSTTSTTKKKLGEILLKKIQTEAAPPKRADRNIRNDSFPWKLYDLLDDMDTSGLNHIVSWEDNGRAMKIHDSQAFVAVIIPYYFPQTKKLESFQRQLNLYGFKRTSRGPQKGFYTHDNLVRGNRELCRLITRPP